MYSAFQPSNLGDEMPKRRKEGRGPDFYVFLLILVVLVLKGLGFLKAWFNIDPNGLTLDAGDLATFGGFLYLWRNFDKEAKTLKKSLDDQSEKLYAKLSEQGERLAKVEAKTNKL